MQAGRLYVFEGPDGTGKTTLSRLFAEALRNMGERVVWTSFPGRSEGTLGKLVYELHHDPERYGVKSVDAESLQLLHVAAHFDAIGQVIVPALQRGEHVVLDRFWWSTRVYGTIGGASADVLNAMLALEAARWGEVQPYVVFLLKPNAPYEVTDDESWRQVEREYEKLASEQELAVRVERVPNRGDVDRVVQMLLKRLRPFPRSRRRLPFVPWLPRIGN